jgi:transcriptional repressor NrdR
MKCPYCGQLDSRVLDSRLSQEQTSIRRRRECLSCHRRFTTYERVEDIPFMVVKKDGRREPFDRAKILTGLRRASEKRPIPASALEAIVERVESLLVEGSEREISSRDIGELIIGQLRELDEVAYVRFASVYRQFRSIEEFMDELKALQGP